METFRKLFFNFLETSTIHGLQYISTENVKLSKFLWIFIVFCGFSVASFLISDSIKSWEESPVSTSVETHPISKVAFPEVTVCPPYGSNTALNHDIKSIKQSGLTKEERKEAFIPLWDASNILSNNADWSNEDVRNMYQGCTPFIYQL